MAFERDEIINVERPAPGKPFADTKARGSNRLTSDLDIDEAPARLLALPLCAFDEVVSRGDVRAKRVDDRIEPTDIVIAVCLFDVHCRHFCAPSAAFTAAPALAKSICPAKRSLSAPIT